MLRLFVAIPVQPGEYDTLRHDFGSLCTGRWSPASQLHLTLAFPGSRYLPGEAIARLDALDLSVTPEPVAGLGYFESRGILYARCESPQLLPLRRRITEALGIAFEPFEPHVTLMRCKKIADPGRFRALLDASGGRLVGRLAPRVVLYSSTLHPDGARHVPLKAWGA